jgi:hypothetical protein
MKSLTNIVKALLVVLLVLSSNLSAQQRKGEPPRRDKPKQQERKPPIRDIEDLKRELGQDWEKIILANIQAEEPDEIEPLQQEKLRNPGRYEEQLAKLWDDVRRLEKFKQEDPARYNNLKKQLQLERDCRKLAQEFRKSKDAARKSQIKADLKNNLTELFNLREAERAGKVTELAQELAQLKEMLAFREKNKDRIIEKRLNEMIGENEILEW